MARRFQLAAPLRSVWHPTIGRILEDQVTWLSRLQVQAMARERRVRRVPHVQHKPQQRSGGVRATGKNRRHVFRVRPRCRQDVQDSDEDWCDEGDDDSGTESERSRDDNFVQADEAVSRSGRRMEPSDRVRRSSAVGFTNLAEEQGTESSHFAQGIMDSPAGRDAKERGKEKVEELDDGVVCGICFTEEIEVDRGKLDCCEHFFCFACILEWSKVESKCPICKQRFVTILKPAQAGVTRSRSRTVRIPTRNQVYVPSQEEIRELADPYTTTVCMECLQPGDDALLLLCDGCDVAAHTYCVGMGTSVPRGDWFCSTCSSAIGDAYGSSESELEESEDFIRSVVRTASRRWKRPKRQSSTRQESRRIQSSQDLRTQNVGQSAALDEVRDNVLSLGPSARTLSSQRVVHQRIQYIRQSWDSLRNGAASFPRSQDSDSLQDMSRLAVERQKQTGSSSDSVASGLVNLDVDKAWEMMEQARAMISHQQNVSTTKSLPALGAREIGTSSFCKNSISHSIEKPTGRPSPGHPTAPNNKNGNLQEEKLTTSQNPVPKLPGSFSSRSAMSFNSQITALGSIDTKGRQASTSDRSLSSANASIAGKRTETTDGKSKGKSTLFEEERHSKRFKSSSGSEQHEHKQQSDASQDRVLKGHHPRISEQHNKVDNVLKVHGQTNTVPAAKASQTEQSKRRAAKEHWSNIVKLELKPFYIDKKIDKEQYKDIARSATHVLLGMVHDNNETMTSRAKVVVEDLLKTRTNCKPKLPN